MIKSSTHSLIHHSFPIPTTFSLLKIHYMIRLKPQKKLLPMHPIKYTQDFSPKCDFIFMKNFHEIFMNTAPPIRIFMNISPTNWIKVLQHRWKRHIPCSWTGRIILSKRLYYTRKSTGTDSMQSHQITKGIFHITRTKNLKICMETQKTPNSQSKHGKEKWSWQNQAPWYQTIYYRATVIKTV